MVTLTIPYLLCENQSLTHNNGCGPPSLGWPTGLLPECVPESPFGTNYFEVCVTPPANLDGTGYSSPLCSKDLVGNKVLGTIHRAGP